MRCQVGNAFVTQYYNVLNMSLQMVHKFYQKDTLLGRPGPNGRMITVTTVEVNLNGNHNEVLSLLVEYINGNNTTKC